MSDVAVTTDEMVLAQAENMRETDTGTQGGAVSDPLVPITGAVVGEWFSKISALESGTLGTDLVIEYAKAFECNTNEDGKDLETALWWVDNLLDDVVTPAAIKIQSSSTADDSTLKQRFWYNVGGELVVDDIVYDGTTLVTGADPVVDMVYRSRTLLSSNDAAATLTGNGTIKVGSVEIGVQPSGFGWSTRELDFWKVATLDDSGTSTNRLTAPAGASWSRCRSESTALDMGTITAGSGRGLWGRLSLEPGMPPVARVDLIPHWKGSST